MDFLKLKENPKNILSLENSSQVILFEIKTFNSMKSYTWILSNRATHVALKPTIATFKSPPSHQLALKSSPSHLLALILLH